MDFCHRGSKHNTYIMDSVKYPKDNNDGKQNGGAQLSAELSPDKETIKSEALVTTPSPSENKLCEEQAQISNDGGKCDGDGANGDIRVRTAAKRVRFSVCEIITETVVHENLNGSHTNPSFEKDEGMDNNSDQSLTDCSDGEAKFRYIRGKKRRDSVHPLVATSSHFPSSPWDVTSVDNDDPDEELSGEPWSELSGKGKLLRVLTGVGKFIALLALLYFFVCSLDLLSLGFRLVGGSAAGEIFRNSVILQNPIVGVMIGVLTTVLVQSSSTSTSIIVGMVAAGFMDVKLAIPPIMGCNIGTSITSTIVSFTQAGDREQFRRAFAGATVLDMFNWISVIVLLPVEVITGYLYHASKATVDLIIPDSQSGGEIQILSVITNPFVDLIVQLNDTVLECWATPNCTDADDASLIKEYCKTAKTEIVVHERVIDTNGKELLNIRDIAKQEDLRRCDFLFAGTNMSDAAVGAIILVASLFVLCFCLVMIVKVLNSVLKGHVSTVIKHTLNADIPYVPWITGYLAILIGAVMTFLLRIHICSDATCGGLASSALTECIHLPLGKYWNHNTAILAAMAAEGNSLRPSLQATCHFFFNVTGVLLFYPVPFLRFPIGMAKSLGNITAKYRWFAIFYLVGMFAILPLVFISLSLAGSIYVVVLVVTVGVFILLITAMTLMQRKVPKLLPVKLRDWKWVPKPLRSLQPYDNLVSKLPCCPGQSQTNNDDSDDEDGKPNLYRDNDFVFLTGNKIPHPDDISREKEQHQQAPKPPIITRIVPTRVIRNISNGTSEHSTVQNGNGVVGTDVKTPLAKNEVTVPLGNNGRALNGIDTTDSNGATTGNNRNRQESTIPMPGPYEDESPLNLPTTNLNRGTSPTSHNGETRNTPSYNLAYASDESVFV
ncbi:Sodium-dependent phosphate transport protein 2B [Orchesella cincta]|uniref:Sodium-dependent phosphate transport protein 2B n=1 Tax=Orchesella cincta TaxID=48709 RepID=A0A1D2M3S7_ORCCI|nr:Sodium-dependent phosphate transport protein 2B [Orchesella cincta]